jgi:hypothetical protein
MFEWLAAVARRMLWWALGCRATRDDLFCTLRRRHGGVHEAWTCGCAGGGRCVEPMTLVGSWPRA